MAAYDTLSASSAAMNALRVLSAPSPVAMCRASAVNNATEKLNASIRIRASADCHDTAMEGTTKMATV